MLWFLECIDAIVWLAIEVMFILKEDIKGGVTAGWP